MLADLRAQISETLHAADVRLHWEVPETGPVVLSLATTQALRSVIREAVQNALRHGRPTVIGVVVGQSGDTITLTITDDGGGFDVSTVTPGHGIANMQARVTGLGGRIEISGDGGSTRIDVCFPLAQGGSAR
jgi:signal transduction histidine kinase